MSKKVLLHICCAPCTVYVRQWFLENDFLLTGYYYNPNIRPQPEYARRLLAMEYYAAVAGLKFMVGQNELETAPGDCQDCYYVRLSKTAQMARKLNCDYFSTTLLISPYQKHELIKTVAAEVSAEWGLPFFYHDFRSGFRRGQQRAKELMLYRQKYCGCGIDLAAREQTYAQVN